MPAPGRIKAYEQGQLAESIACWILRLKGYRILATRYKTPVGEVDIIARRGNMLVFAEVKARQTITEALQSLTGRMKKRIIRAASAFIAANPAYASSDIRFDLLAIRLPCYWQHLDNAWRPEA